jgi:flagellar basal-body rod protein FlgB
VSTSAIGAIQASLDGLAARERIISQNLANADTPGYIAGRVDFESSLRKAVADGNPSEFSVNTSSSTDPSNLNGNNVSVDAESVSLTDTTLHFQLMTEAMNNSFHVLHEAMRRDL